jgi:hypothetical protein
MRKLALLLIIALMGFAQQMKAADVVNNTNCAISVHIVFYNATTCAITGSCTTLTIPAHSTVAIPACISSSVSLLGFEVCWSPSACTNCASIGNGAGAHPCAQFPAGPVTLSTDCSSCISATANVTISWTATGDFVVG